MIILSLIYGLILLFFALGNFLSKSKVKKATNFEPISVIVAAKNEEKTINDTVTAILNQNYPCFELIVANDSSTDNTFKILQQNKNPKLTIVNVTTVYKNHVGKKNALVQAINVAKYNNLAFCDADCTPEKNWLQTINSHFAQNSQFVVGYSPYTGMKNKFSQSIKNLERTGISAVASGACFYNWGLTCVGRNMAYTKTFFEQNNGFAGIENLLSGDDDLLLQKFNPKLKKVSFMFEKEGFVYSNDDNSNAISRETRRASKFKYYPISLKLLLLFTAIYYSAFAYAFIASLLSYFNLNQFLILLAIKTFFELLLLASFCFKTKQTKLLLFYPIIAIFYVPYYIIFGTKGTFGRYRWVK